MDKVEIMFKNKSYDVTSIKASHSQSVILFYLFIFHSWAVFLRIFWDFMQCLVANIPFQDMQFFETDLQLKNDPSNNGGWH